MIAAAALALSLLAAQGGQDQQPPIPIRPGAVPEGTRPAPASIIAEPLGLVVAGFDADGDGLTSRAELQEGLRRTFAGADANGDGALGYIEYSGWATHWLGNQSAVPGAFAIDADGDNRITLAEMAVEFERQFVRLDADASGTLSRAELVTIRNPRAEPLPRQPEQRLPDRRRRQP